jgi:hypothetical protein
MGVHGQHGQELRSSIRATAVHIIRDESGAVAQTVAGTSDDSKATGTLRCQTSASSSSVDPRVFTVRLTGS